MQKFIAWIFSITAKHVYRTYYHCYGEGAHARILGDSRLSNPYRYGVYKHDAWNDGWDVRK
jgi:hypothetical protein